MTNALIQKKKEESDQEIILKLLEHVEGEESISQGSFAEKIGIAKGLANAYFNRCIRKGWVKLRQAPRQRYLYYLTPQGFAEKARLTAQFLAYSYEFYRQSREDFVTLLQEVRSQGHHRVAVIGAGELAEIAAIVSHEAAVQIVGFLDKAGTRETLAGCPVSPDLAGLGSPVDAAVLAHLEGAYEAYEDFRTANPGIPVFVPRQLRSLVARGAK